jgi:hypothetical protein
MTAILDIIWEEFTHPFRDPRTPRTPSTENIPMQKLFFMLIDESERTFKRGVIVTVVRI